MVSVIPLVSHSFLWKSKAYAFMIGPEKIAEMSYELFLQFYQPVMGIPSSHFCLNHKNTALSCSSSFAKLHDPNGTLGSHLEHA